MRITASYEAFKEYMSHRPDLSRNPFLVQVGVTKAFVTDALGDSVHWTFPPSVRPTYAEFKKWAVTATIVDNWIL